MKVQVNCEFITPLLELSTEQLDFRVDKPPTEHLHLPRKPIELTNVSSLPLTSQLIMEYPFRFVVEEREPCQQLVRRSLFLSFFLSLSFSLSLTHYSSLTLTFSLHLKLLFHYVCIIELCV